MPEETARLVVRLCSWGALVAAVLGGVLIAWPHLLPWGGPWVQLGLGITTLVLAFRARKVGMAHVTGYDGRLSLAAALIGFLVVFFAGQFAFGVIVNA